jgi:CDP-glycerol glycerophosphotransferase (TagB/SpsB family)
VTIASTRSSEFQALLARCVTFITDYTSVAFDAALLRTPIFYFQFDRDAFFGGEHNWRPGYFDYERDGFGPVACDEETLVASLVRHVEEGCPLAAKYRERMERAMPNADNGACERTYEAIAAIKRPARPA